MSKELPLKGVKIVDLSTFAAAPGAARMLADWGADVVKVESLHGDAWRFYGTLGSTPATAEENPCWEIQNANKRSLAVDLKSTKGKAILYKLLAEADVFITNLRIKALRKLKLTYEELAGLYPRLVWAHISGYGVKGPDAERPGFDVAAYWARSGMMTDLCQPGDPPLTQAYAFGDNSTGSILCAGICAALYKQQRTGQGEKVSISLLGNAIWSAGLMVASTQERYGDEFPKSRLFPSSPLCAMYKCKDGEWLLLCIIEYERYYSAFCKVMGREDLIDDERYNTLQAVKNYSQEFVQLLDRIFATKNRDEWCEKLLAVDIVCDKILHFSEVAKDEQAWANDYLYHFAYRNGEQAILPNTPIQFKAERGFAAGAPLLGEHTREILFELGYTADEVEDFLKQEIVSSR